MSKTISIVNAGSILGQNFLRNLSGFNRVILSDCVNGRRSFLRTVHNLRKSDPSVTLEHKNINSPVLLEGAIKESSICVFFTHDYYSMVVDKNAQLKSAAEICKAYNLEKFIVVNPIEFINYYNSDGFRDSPVKDEAKVQEEALKIFPKTSILRSDLVFGSRSYLVRYLVQNWMNDYSPFESEHFKSFRFNPIHYNDLNDMIQILVTDESKTFEGKKLSAQGNESLSYFDVDNMVRQSYSSKSSHVLPNKWVQKIVQNWQLLFHGNTHVTNMNFMLNYLHNNNPQFNDYQNAAQLMGLKPQSCREYYVDKAEKFDDKKFDSFSTNEEPDDLRFPRLHNYWNLSLD